MVSGKHAALLSLPDHLNIFYVQDWSSKGTLVNGILVKGQRHRLIEGDVIYFGDRHAKTRMQIQEIRPANSCLPPSIVQEPPVSMQEGSRRSRASQRARGSRETNSAKSGCVRQEREPTDEGVREDQNHACSQSPLPN